MHKGEPEAERSEADGSHKLMNPLKIHIFLKKKIIENISKHLPDFKHQYDKH